MPAPDLDERPMARAVELAARGLGTTSPNPVVGSVLVAPDGTVVGEGWHERAGGPHAEVNALAAAGDRARGATAYVTLEPCNHTGRTGPCAQALLRAGVARVVYAVPDPGAVEGGGADTLRAAGVEVLAGVLAPQAERVNEAWLVSARSGRPHVLWKFAATLDGRSAAADGTSRWISSAASREEVHDLRRRVDAVVAGSGTVLADDPHLTARAADGTPSGRQPLRVVLDRRGRVPAGARVLDDAAPTLVSRAGTPAELLAELRGRGVVSVLLEGGPTLAGAFLAAGLVDRVVAYVAPTLLGAGTAALAGTGVTTITDAIGLDVDDVSVVGGDVRVSGRPRR
ncbi:bifunctional diaminohydroxyphosphoribosylaminopyrimidine deaminase/5-amino-6-(5-phosphoribosylamino)uracil reductase RibD [Kineococcus aurantiacus]|uniref:Riboflavin biosynthesis protein RibD n=1 Tax=Kineococcus aurantiacus TaxID=37633 RepID=A0A7Y9J0S9_9ACTN|nr:bifunctional diaminohydroxyphosphoribosylaminopyrimidine deaminase/5-amino-6-(5-phosphoribosylamino)uracil reductase RibD [Kineococcus aurantiacus]NYD22551.1 diaminohydroxyphosphoribosylaminopyrimidine deaminase/5-amino-6-(5-phosphoribosylamino)uracil reductase [Kineococcus aurantiacus]